MFRVAFTGSYARYNHIDKSAHYDDDSIDSDNYGYKMSQQCYD